MTSTFVIIVKGIVEDDRVTMEDIQEIFDDSDIELVSVRPQGSHHSDHHEE